jgi:hypothetical protein
MWKSHYRVIERLVVVARKGRLLQQTPYVRNASSSEVTDVIKDKVTKAFQPGSTAATDAFQNKKLIVIHVVRVTSDSIRGQVQKGSNAVSNAASDGIVHVVSHHVQSSTKTASDTSCIGLFQKPQKPSRHPPRQLPRPHRNEYKTRRLRVFGNAHESGKKPCDRFGGGLLQ